MRSRFATNPAHVTLLSSLTAGSLFIYTRQCLQFGDLLQQSSSSATKSDGFASYKLVSGLPIREPNSRAGQTVAPSRAASSYLNTNVGQNVVELLWCA
jgi:hypothetical protein